jgi:predicted TIM-barrel fold metal-dependent hydrolase
MNYLEEDALEPDLPIIDPHHHFYDRPQIHYMFEELLADTKRGHNIRKTVYIETTAMSRACGPEALRPVGETEFVNGAAAMSASGLYGEVRLCAGIVGYADLALGERVGEALAAHIAAGGGRFRGIRQAAYWDSDETILKFVRRRPPQGLLCDPSFRDGFAQLHKHGLSFDALLWHNQLPDLIDLARAHPETPIVLNHMASPLGVGRYAGRRAEVFEAWRRDMRVLATCGNVTVKLGGFGMDLAGFDFVKRPGTATSDELAEAWGPYVETCIEAFGPARCMFESNFPVDRATCGYGVLWNSFKKISRQYNEQERAELFYGTAARVYRLTSRTAIAAS